MTALTQFVDAVDKKCSSLPYLPDIAAKAKTKPAYIALAVCAAFLMFILMMIGFNAIVNIICFAYPAMAALKAMQTKPEKYDEQWLTYFMIFGKFHVAESFYPSLLTDVSFYVLFKFLVLVWCFLPQSTGAQKVYSFFIKKVLAAVGPKPESKTE